MVSIWPFQHFFSTIEEGKCPVVRRCDVQVVSFAVQKANVVESTMEKLDWKTLVCTNNRVFEFQIDSQEIAFTGAYHVDLLVQSRLQLGCMVAFQQRFTFGFRKVLTVHHHEQFKTSFRQHQDMSCSYANIDNSITHFISFSNAMPLRDKYFPIRKPDNDPIAVSRQAPNLWLKYMNASKLVLCRIDFEY